MEKKGFIHADIEKSEKKNIVTVQISGYIDNDMATSGIRGILSALIEQDKLITLLVWANASRDAFGYDDAAAALIAVEQMNGQAEFVKKKNRQKSSKKTLARDYE